MESFWGLPSAGWVAVYSIATGVYALLTGSLALVTYMGIRSQAKVSREAATIQARASSISNNRQQWINSLRDEVVAFLTDIDTRTFKIAGKEIFTIEAQQVLAASLRRRIYKVELLINPTEGESTELLNMMRSALSEGLSEQTKRILLVIHSEF